MIEIASSAVPDMPRNSQRKLVGVVVGERYLRERKDHLEDLHNDEKGPFKKI